MDAASRGLQQGFMEKQTGCTQDTSKMVLGNYSKEEPGQHSGTAGSAVCTMPAPGSHLGNPPQSRRKPEG